MTKQARRPGRPRKAELGKGLERRVELSRVKTTGRCTRRRTEPRENDFSGAREIWLRKGPNKPQREPKKVYELLLEKENGTITGCGEHRTKNGDKRSLSSTGCNHRAPKKKKSEKAEGAEKKICDKGTAERRVNPVWSSRVKGLFWGGRRKSRSRNKGNFKAANVEKEPRITVQ